MRFLFPDLYVTDDYFSPFSAPKRSAEDGGCQNYKRARGGSGSNSGGVELRVLIESKVSLQLCPGFLHPSLKNRGKELYSDQVQKCMSKALFQALKLVTAEICCGICVQLV